LQLLPERLQFGSAATRRDPTMKCGTLLAAALFLALPLRVAAEDLRAPAMPVSELRHQGGLPTKFEKAVVEQKLDAQVPLELTFKDEAGRDVKLGEVGNGKPVLLVLAYYRCPGLCTTVINGVVERTKRMWRFQAARNYEVVIVSFDPKDTPEL